MRMRRQTGWRRSTSSYRSLGLLLQKPEPARFCMGWASARPCRADPHHPSLAAGECASPLPGAYCTRATLALCFLIFLCSVMERCRRLSSASVNVKSLFAWLFPCPVLHLHRLCLPSEYSQGTAECSFGLPEAGFKGALPIRHKSVLSIKPMMKRYNGLNRSSVHGVSARMAHQHAAEGMLKQLQKPSCVCLQWQHVGDSFEQVIDQLLYIQSKRLVMHNKRQHAG